VSGSRRSIAALKRRLFSVAQAGRSFVRLRLAEGIADAQAD
jgi:hypothetical protein